MKSKTKQTNDLEQMLANFDHDNMTADDHLSVAVLMDEAASQHLVQAEALEA